MAPGTRHLEVSSKCQGEGNTDVLDGQGNGIHLEQGFLYSLLLAYLDVERFHQALRLLFELFEFIGPLLSANENFGLKVCESTLLTRL